MAGKRDARRDRLFDIAMRGDFTKNDVMTSELWSSAQFTEAVRDLRLWFATTGDKVNLAAEPGGFRKQWRYFLTGDFTEAEEWIRIRCRDLESRLETSEAVAVTLVLTTDGRSTIGKKVRKIQRTLEYLRSELVDLDGSSAV